MDLNGSSPWYVEYENAEQIFFIVLHACGISEKILSHDTCHSTIVTLFVGHPWYRDETKMETAGSD